MTVKLHERLPWLFVALVLLLGLPLFLVEDRELARRWAGLIAVCLAGFAFSITFSAWVTGEIKLKEFHYYRTRQPRRFYATLALLLLVGGATLVSGVLALLGRLR